jgi:hypothetical protein
MKPSIHQLALATATLGLCSPALAVDIKLVQISTSFPSPIGIDYHEPTDSVVMSVNYNNNGQPNNFVRVKADGTQVGFSSISGLTDEVKIATARSGGAFAAGTLFTGNGIDGQITKISPDGSSFINNWVDLPGSGNGLMRGSLYVDRTGVWGGDLLAVTTGGEAWRVNSAGTPTQLADVNVHLEGLITVPNDPSKYGPLAGKAIAGAEGQNRLYAFGANGSVDYYPLSVAIEDIDMISANENFYGVNFGTGRLLGAEASQFASLVGDILLTQEFASGSGLFTLRWNGSSLVTTPLGLTGDSAIPGQWEHVTFAPAGIVEIPKTPDSGNVLTLLGAGFLGLVGIRGWSRRTA